MTVAKVFAAVFCGSVILLQAYPILAGTHYNNYYWPFVNYPMYSDSHRMGESVSSLKLRAIPCRSGAASVAVNPMVSGSGTNLKIVEYLAAGVPVVSTPFGMRGLDLRPDEHLCWRSPKVQRPNHEKCRGRGEVSRL